MIIVCLKLLFYYLFDACSIGSDMKNVYKTPVFTGQNHVPNIRNILFYGLGVRVLIFGTRFGPAKTEYGAPHRTDTGRENKSPARHALSIL